MTELLEKEQDTTDHEISEYLETFKPRAMDWAAARVFAAKNLRIAVRYPANILIWGFLPILWFAPYVLMATAVGGLETTAHFTEISGYDDFIQFVVIGWFVYMYMDNSIWGIGNNFRWEQFSGTLEPLFSTPVPRIRLFFKLLSKLRLGPFPINPEWISIQSFLLSFLYMQFYLLLIHSN